MGPETVVQSNTKESKTQKETTTVGSSTKSVVGVLKPELDFIDTSDWIVVPVTEKGWREIAEQSKKEYNRLTRLSAWS